MTEDTSNTDTVRVDEFGVPTLSAVSQMPLAEHTEDCPRLEAIVNRKLTFPELSWVESMGSEHASYGSSRFYLKTVLPVNGSNHVTGIGDESASVVLWVDPKTKKSVTTKLFDNYTIAKTYTNLTHYCKKIYVLQKPLKLTNHVLINNKRVIIYYIQPKLHRAIELLFC